LTVKDSRLEKYHSPLNRTIACADTLVPLAIVVGKMTVLPSTPVLGEDPAADLLSRRGQRDLISLIARGARNSTTTGRVAGKSLVAQMRHVEMSTLKHKTE